MLLKGLNPQNGTDTKISQNRPLIGQESRRLFFSFMQLLLSQANCDAPSGCTRQYAPTHSSQPANTTPTLWLHLVGMDDCFPQLRLRHATSSSQLKQKKSRQLSQLGLRHATLPRSQLQWQEWLTTDCFPQLRLHHATLPHVLVQYSSYEWLTSDCFPHFDYALLHCLVHSQQEWSTNDCLPNYDYNMQRYTAACTAAMMRGPHSQTVWQFFLIKPYRQLMLITGSQGNGIDSI